jgi:HPt (histidine-containing phosphotransfer) domain-containing protein
MKARAQDPAIASFADHDVITPPNPLSRAIEQTAARDGDDDAVARAEVALAGLAHEFSAWMHAECERLARARREVAIRGFTGVTRDELFRAAHDIKGQAETFGFPRAGEVASSLCRLVDQARDARRIPRDLLDQHVDAIRAIVREAAQDGADETAAALGAQLHAATDEFLRHETAARASFLDEIIAPRIVPTQEF